MKAACARCPGCWEMERLAVRGLLGGDNARHFARRVKEPGLCAQCWLAFCRRFGRKPDEQAEAAWPGEVSKMLRVPLRAAPA